jgi:hypothetical protein
MSSGSFHLVAVVRTDVSDNISPPSSGFLTMIGFHNCVTVGSLLISLSTEGYFIGSKNTVLWDIFTAVSIPDAF